MKKRIGLFPPFFALLGLALLGWVLPKSPEDPWLRILLSPQSYFLIVSLLILQYWDTKPGPFSRTTWKIPKQIGVGLILSLVPVLLFLLVWGILNLLQDPSESAAPIDLGISGPRWFILILLAPLSEEILFRGILCRAIRNYYRPWVAVLFSALVFTFSHGGFVLGPFILGLVTAVIFLRSGSVLPGILFHSVSNCYVPLVTLFFPSAMERIRFLL